MSTIRKVFTSCDHCKKEILEGNAMMSITRNIEQADWNFPENDFEITIVESLELITLCGRCANNLDTETLKKFLMHFPLGNNYKKN